MIQTISNHEFGGRGLSTFGSNLGLPRHRWFEFKEGFSEELVQEACKSVSADRKKLSILDPFSGSGTTLVASGRLGHNCIGIELNPFLAFAARAKSTRGHWRKKQFDHHLGKVLSSSLLEVRSALEGISTFTEREDSKQWLFNLSVLRGFTALDRALLDSSHYRGPLRLGLFSALMDNCNAKRDGKCLRYKKGWGSLGYSSKELRERFEARAKLIFEDLSAHPFKSDLNLIQGDTREKLTQIKKSSIDLVVTSPPYLNSFDYSDVYRPELFVGGFVRSNQHLRGIRLRTIRSHVQAAWKPADTISTPLLNPLLKSLRDADELWNKRIPDMVQAYFADMQTVLSNLHRAVRSGGEAWVVVATSAYSGIHISTDLLLADTAARVGWSLGGVYVLRHTRAAGQQWHSISSETSQPLRESLIILKRP